MGSNSRKLRNSQRLNEAIQDLAAPMYQLHRLAGLDVHQVQRIRRQRRSYSLKLLKSRTSVAQVVHVRIHQYRRHHKSYQFQLDLLRSLSQILLSLRHPRMRDAEKQRARRDEEQARKDAVRRSKAEAIEERARKKAEAEQLRGAVKRGKKLEPLVVDDAASYVSFDESVGTFAGGPSLDALSASPGQHTVGTLRTFDT